MFIEMVHIRPAFARNGLLRPALEGWYEALRRLTEWFAFPGTLVLVPSRPEGPKGEAWGEASPEDVEKTLIAVYRKNGFEIWVLEGKLNGELITVMGRTTPDAENDQEDDQSGN